MLTYADVDDADAADRYAAPAVLVLTYLTLGLLNYLMYIGNARNYLM
jgi:hypothetical protein